MTYIWTLKWFSGALIRKDKDQLVLLPPGDKSGVLVRPPSPRPN